MMLLARFASQDALLTAARGLRAARVGQVETYTPTEPPEPDRADTEVSRLPLLVLAAGVLAAVSFFLLQWYANARGYPIDIGGRPDFSWPAFVPNSFEFGVLCAVSAGFIAYLASNGLPRLFDPVDRSLAFRDASRDGYFLTLEAMDADSRTVLDAQHPLHVEEIAE